MRVIAVTLAGSLALALAGCGEGEDSAPATDADTSAAQELRELACIDEGDLGSGMEIPVGIDVALSGQGAYYGEVMTAAAELAVKHIEAAGGPKFELVVKDHKSGDAQAGVATTRELGQAGVKMALYSFIGVLGSAFAGIEQYKILSLDGGGGTQKFGQGKPYFYGTRSQSPNDSFPGVALYLQEVQPDVDSVAFVIGDTGAENVKDSTDLLTAELAKVGVELGDTEVVTYGGTDFATAVSKINSTDVDLIVLAQFGTDPGYFLKQYRGAGGELPVVGTDVIPDALEIAGPEAAAGYVAAQQYFNPEDPGNAWGEYFVDEWTKAYPDKPAPDFYASNYYQDMFTLWRTVQRTLADGGDVDNSEDLLAAFTADLTFPAVAGPPEGDSACGSYSIDPDTHTVTSTSMGIGEVQDDGTTIVQIGSFDIGGADFEMFE